MQSLKGSQRKYLRGLAHSWRPVVQIGKEGLGENVVRTIDQALEARELIKIKIAAERDEREELIPLIEARLNCECVGSVGKTAVFYRQHPEAEKRSITVPPARP